MNKTNIKYKYKFNKFVSILYVVLFMLLATCSYCPETLAAEVTDEEEETTTEYPKTTEYPEEPWRMPDTVGEAQIVMDASTGQILYERNAYKKMYPASITKIMTALLGIEYGDFNDHIIMSETAVYGIEPGSSNIALQPGEEITYEDAMNAVLLVSANEAAWAVAEYVAGSMENFADMMNEKAEALGCVNTHFVNSHGLHDPEHYTCPYDMALIAREALKLDKFREITGTTHYIIPPTNMQEEERNLWQNNKLIMGDSYLYYDYCEGGKTGFTDEARGTFVTWAKKDDVELIFVTMGNYPTNTSYTDARAMFDYFFNNYSYASPLTDYEFSDADIAAAEAYLDEIYDAHNIGELSLSVDTDATFLIKSEATDSLIISYNPGTFSEEEGLLGELNVSDEQGTDYISLPVTYSGYVAKPNTTETVTEATADATSSSIASEAQAKNRETLIIIVTIAMAILSMGVLGVIIYMIKNRG